MHTYMVAAFRVTEAASTPPPFSLLVVVGIAGAPAYANRRPRTADEHDEERKAFLASHCKHRGERCLRRAEVEDVSAASASFTQPRSSERWHSASSSSEAADSGEVTERRGGENKREEGPAASCAGEDKEEKGNREKKI